MQKNFLKILNILSSFWDARLVKSVFIVIICVFFLTISYSNDINRFHLFDSRDGLSNNYISCIYQDKNGFMWFGTREGGVNRFNGKDFQTYFHRSNGSGLTHNYVTCIVQDKRGIIWIGTMGGGINYFDPYKEEIDNINSKLKIISYLPSKIIHDLYVDSLDNLWIGSTAGLTRYSYDKQSFKIYRNEGDRQAKKNAYKVLNIVETSPGLILVGTERGLDLFNSTSETFQSILDGYEIRTIMKDSFDNIWIGTNKGLFHSTVPSIVSNEPVLTQIKSVKTDIINTLIEDVNRNIWVGTNNNGIRIINKDGILKEHILPDPKLPYSLADPAINYLYVDRYNSIWIGTNTAGVNMYSPYNKPFIPLSIYDSNRRSKAYINQSYIDSQENLWIATREGLKYYDKKNKDYKTINHPENNNFTYVIELSDGKIIVGLFNDGIYFYNKENNTFSRDRFAGNSSLLNQKVWCLFQDKSDNVWIGTIGNGVFKIDGSNNKVKHYLHDKNDKNTLSSNFVKYIIEDTEGNIWFLNNWEGVSMKPADSEKFVRFLHDNSIENSLLDNSVEDIFLDRSGNLFISTYEGLCRFNYKDNSFIPVFIGQNFKEENVKSIRFDKEGNWWLITKNSIIRYNPENQALWDIGNFGIHLGELKRSSLQVFKDGEMAVSGTNETVLFDPELIHKNPITPKIVLTRFFVNHGEVSDFGEGSLLNEPLNYVHEVVLNHKQRIFSIEFTNLAVYPNDKAHFIYRLHGYDEEWVKSNSDNRATYTNLDPGQYVFQIRARNSDGMWSEETKELAIVLLPPWWKTIVFKVIVLSLFVASIVIFVRLRENSLKRQQIYLENLVKSKTNELQCKNEELIGKQEELIQSQHSVLRKKEQLEEVNSVLVQQNNEIQEMNRTLLFQKKQLEKLTQLKNRFFANISHEFRTPLTLILGPLENLSKRLNDEPEYLIYTELIERNSKRLLGLINQLLDISRLEFGKANLKVAKQDITQFVISIFRSFSFRAERMNIMYTYKGIEEPREAYFDADKVEKILFNLISNAFKFTPSGGNIVVKVDISTDLDFKEQHLVMSVQDSGIGIPKNKLKQVFDYYTQIAQSTTGIPGAGIGLSLVKQVSELHRGSVSIESEEERGTKVTAKIRIDPGAFYPNEIVTVSSTNEYYAREIDYKASIEDIGDEIEILPEYKISDDASYVLVIEDNHDVLLYVKDILNSKFNILTATKGEEGFEIAEQMVPDLVICDLMLPDCNGIDVCRRIKNNELTNHIPIIILTAMGSDENMHKGLESGVDNYITKPFNPFLLSLRVNNLIKTRTNLIQRFKTNFISTELKVLRSKSNEQFVQKLVNLIEENIENPEFSNDEIAKQLNVSTRQLYRKLDGVINMPLNKFIRHIKMKKAKEIMGSVPDITIAEVAYKIGYNDPKYFSKCFKEEFGSLPSELLKAE